MGPSALYLQRIGGEETELVALCTSFSCRIDPIEKLSRDR